MWTCDLMEFYVWRLGLTFCSCVSIGHYCLCYNIDVAPPGHGIAWEARQNSWKMKTFAEKVAYLAKNQTTMFLRSPLMVRAFKVANVLHQRFARSLNIRPALPAVSCCYMSVVSKARQWDSALTPALKIESSQCGRAHNMFHKTFWNWFGDFAIRLRFYHSPGSIQGHVAAAGTSRPLCVSNQFPRRNHSALWQAGVQNRALSNWFSTC